MDGSGTEKRSNYIQHVRTVGFEGLEDTADLQMRECEGDSVFLIEGIQGRGPGDLGEVQNGKKHASETDRR